MTGSRGERIALLVFAGIGMLAVMWGGLFLLVRAIVGDGDPLDRTFVLAVEPGPRNVAVVYLYHHADSTSETLRVALRPLQASPRVGDTFERGQDAAAAALTGWSGEVERNPAKAGEFATRILAVRWRPDGVLEVCPQRGVSLIYFSADAGLGLWERRAALCESPGP